MLSLMRAEYIKGRRSFGRRSLIIFPLFVLVLSVVLMSGQLTQMGAYNWWYMLMGPIVIALVCVNLTGPEKQMDFFNISCLPIPHKKTWLAKIAVGCSYVFAANIVVFGLSALAGLIFGAQFPVERGLLACLILTITWLWQIPLGMFLSVKFNSTVTFLMIFGANLVCSVQTIAGGDFWMIPFAIAARLMTPTLGINPNGVALADTSPLNDVSVILPGLLITLVLFVVGVLVTKVWFEKRSVGR